MAQACLWRLRPARLDQTSDEQMPWLQRVELLILDDLAPPAWGAPEASDFYELVVEGHRAASTITTSNRDPAEIVTMMADPLWPDPRSTDWEIRGLRLVVDARSYRQRQKSVPAHDPH